MPPIAERPVALINSAPPIIHHRPDRVKSSSFSVVKIIGFEEITQLFATSPYIAINCSPSSIESQQSCTTRSSGEKTNHTTFVAGFERSTGLSALGLKSSGLRFVDPITTLISSLSRIDILSLFGCVYIFKIAPVGPCVKALFHITSHLLD